MRLDLQTLYLTLLPREPVTIAGGVGTEIRILEGRVWLTEENVPDDVFLFPGSTYVLRQSGRAVLDADDLTRIVVDAPVSVRSESWISVSFGALRRAIAGSAARLPVSVKPASVAASTCSS